MDTGALILVLMVAVLVVFFISRPFIESRRIRVASAEEHELSSLLAERDRLINALQELDFDHTLGKIPAEDYPVMRANLLQRAARALRKLDEFQPQSVSADAQARVEAAVAARRADAAENQAIAPAFSDEALDELLAARRASRKEKAAGFCPSCGKPVMQSDRFCPGCGKALK